MHMISMGDILSSPFKNMAKAVHVRHYPAPSVAPQIAIKSPENHLLVSHYWILMTAQALQSQPNLADLRPQLPAHSGWMQL